MLLKHIIVKKHFLGVLYIIANTHGSGVIVFSDLHRSIVCINRIFVATGCEYDNTQGYRLVIFSDRTPTISDFIGRSCVVVRNITRRILGKICRLSKNINFKRQSGKEVFIGCPGDCLFLGIPKTGLVVSDDFTVHCKPFILLEGIFGTHFTNLRTFSHIISVSII